MAEIQSKSFHVFLCYFLQLEFCEKEREELSKRFKELKEQLTEQQQCELDVKLETSEKHIPLICVGDGEEDDDIVFILPEDYSPRKRQKLDFERKSEKFDNTDNQPKKDLAITFFKPGTNLPHAREHCAAYKFVQSNVTIATVSCNESYCEQCYCYVCDALVKEVRCNNFICFNLESVKQNTCTLYCSFSCVKLFLVDSDMCRSRFGYCNCLLLPRG